MSAQSEGNYKEALQNYYEAMRLKINPYDRSYILYNIGLIHTSNGEHTKALEYYFLALEIYYCITEFTSPGQFDPKIYA